MRNTVKRNSARALALLLTASILLCIPVSASAVGYTDVKEGDWFYSYVTDLSAAGVVDGYGDGRFGPTDTTSLGAALKLIMRAAGIDECAPTDTHWASGYLDKAKTLGLLDSTDATSLDGAVSRLTIAKIAARAMSMIRSKYNSPFSDTDDGYVTALYRCGVITGSTNAEGALVYNPNDSITRAEISAIIWRIANTDVHKNQINAGSYYAEILDGEPTNPYDLTAFALTNGFMVYGGGVQTHKGIDVSEFQGDIDWQQVAASGVEYVFIRLGYRGYGSAGTLVKDAKFERNYEGATAAGLKVGVYIFSQAVNAAEGREEAQFVLDTLGGRALSYPVLFDWENISYDVARTDNITSEALGQAANAFCDAIEAAGHTPLVYMSCYVGYVKYDLRDISRDVCLAQYNDKPDFYYAFNIWQYTDSGSVPGISGAVDMEISFKDYGV